MRALIFIPASARKAGLEWKCDLNQRQRSKEGNASWEKKIRGADVKSHAGPCFKLKESLADEQSVAILRENPKTPTTF